MDIKKRNISFINGNEGYVVFDKKILLIDPPLFQFLNENQPSPPLGLCYIAGYMAEKGFQNIRVYNADFNPDEDFSECNRAFSQEVDKFAEYKKQITDENHFAYKNVLATIRDFKPDIIGILSKTAKFFVIGKMIELIKAEFPNVFIVVGGPHATSSDASLLEKTKADLVIRGEGEVTFYEVVKEYLTGTQKFDSIDGISYRDNTEIIRNSTRRLIDNLDEIPFPRKDLVLQIDKVHADNMGGLFSSRGCPFACSFCDARATWTRRVRRRSAKNIVQEILQTRENYGTKFFTFSDDCFVTNKEDLFSFCAELEQVGLASLPRKEFRWWCEVHPQLISEESILRMRDAGCVAVAMGVESGSEKTLEKINKKSSLDLVRKTAKIIKDAGLNLVVFCMIGFPWETKADIEETVRFMEELQPDSGNLSILTPLPGSPIYEYCKEQNLLDYDETFINCFHQREGHFYSHSISDEESSKIIKDAFARVDQIIEGTRVRKIQQAIQAEVAYLSDVQVLTDKTQELNVNKWIIVDQMYADRRIFIELASDLEKELDKDKLVRHLFEKMPQYVFINIKHKEGELVFFQDEVMK